VKRVDTQLREWAEQLSMLLERDGLPRMAGRIFGWLLVCDPPQQSMEDLAGAVQGSKASMSTMTRLLAQAGLIEKVRPPGARRDAFRIGPGQWQQLWRGRLQMLNEVSEVIGRGLALMGGRPAAERARLEELHQQYRFIGRHLPELLERLERERTGADATRQHAARPPRNRSTSRRIS
jgi:hypothetical protein